jgi:hypothetical protein
MGRELDHMGQFKPQEIMCKSVRDFKEPLSKTNGANETSI